MPARSCFSALTLLVALSIGPTSAVLGGMPYPTSPFEVDRIGGMPGAAGDVQMSGARASADSPDRDFAMKAASAGQMMVALGRKAQMQGLDAGVKRYARRVVEDHRGAMDELRLAARGKQIPVGSTMTGEHQGAINRLARLRGMAFDRAYARQQVGAHRKAVELFEDEVRHGRDPELRAWAAGMLPALREHLRMAREVDAEIADR